MGLGLGFCPRAAIEYVAYSCENAYETKAERKINGNGTAKRRQKPNIQKVVEE